jgi:hypothetical protein
MIRDPETPTTDVGPWSAPCFVEENVYELGKKVYFEASVERHGRDYDIPRQKLTITVTYDEREINFRNQVFFWLCLHPGANARQVSKQFEISGLRAGQIIDDLLGQGVLEFAD